MIRISKLNKYFNKGKNNQVHVINDVSVELPDNGLVCIIGESGSGKTTLMNTIGGLDNYKSGEIEVYGQTFKNNNNKKYEAVRNENFGYIFQNYYLLDGQTVYKNIEICLNMYEVDEKEKESRINQVLKAVGMEKYKKRIVNHLSGGQQQRVAIARALVKSPNVIFADEPTGNLDEENTLNMMAILKKISKTCLVVIVTHEKNIAYSFADRIIQVSDGKIISDKEITNNNMYKYIDNNNIYLKDLEEVSTEDECGEYKYYFDKCNKSNFESNKINMSIVFKDGKYYIKNNNDCDVVFISDDKKIKMLNKHKPELNAKEVQENLQLDITKIDSSKPPTLTIKQIFGLALNNIRMFGKRQIFLIVSLLIISVLTTATINDFISINTIDKKSIVKNDSHYLTIDVVKDSYLGKDEHKKYVGEIYDKIKDLDVTQSVFVSNKTEFKFEYKGFVEIQGVKAEMTRFNLVPLEYINKENVLYGRLPENPGEIVVDLQVTEQFIKRNPTLSLVFKSPNSMLNKEFTLSRKKTPYKIVGISDTEEAAIYINKIDGLGALSWLKEITNFEYIKNMFPNIFGNITLSKGQILTKEYFGKIGDTIEILNSVYEIKGHIDDDCLQQMVFADSSYDTLLRDACCYSRKFNVYTNNKQAIIDFCKELSLSKDFNKVKIVVKDNYKNDLLAYENQRKIRVNAKVIIIFATMLVCLVILYYTMKSNALRNIKNISVYRLLGIKKSSIALLYIVENIIISSYTTLIGVLITSSVYKFLASIQSLKLKDVLSWYVVLGTILVLYILNIIIGLLPIRGILRLMPAQITTKYDI